MDFADYVREHRGKLTIFATVLTGKTWLAEDLVSDVLGKAFERWAHIGEVEHPHAYVRRMVVNEYISSWRRHSRVIASEDLRDYDRPIESAQSAHAARDEMLLRLAGLPNKQRAALVLRYYLDLSDSQIAMELGCREATARGYISRGLRALRIDFAAERDNTPLDALLGSACEELT